MRGSIQRSSVLLPLLAAYTGCTPQSPTMGAAVAEQPPLMAGEARYAPMGQALHNKFRQQLEPFCNSATEVWMQVPRRADNGSFTWCTTPTNQDSQWVCLGKLSTDTTKQLAKETLAVEYSDTLDYWLNFSLRNDGHELRFSLCPAEEFGIRFDSVKLHAKSFHKTIWAMADKQFAIQKRFDKVVHF